METSNYRVVLEQFAYSHFIKSFKKRHKAHWAKTELDIINVCERIDMMLQYSRADLIVTVGSYKIIKLDFAVEGTHISPKASGNRCILLADDDERSVRVLLIYSKNDVGSGQETAWWRQMIKKNFPDVRDTFQL